MYVVTPRRKTGYQNNEFYYSESGEEFSVFTVSSEHNGIRQAHCYVFSVLDNGTIKNCASESERRKRVSHLDYHCRNYSRTAWGRILPSLFSTG